MATQFNIGHLQKDIDKAIKTLRAFGDEFDKEAKRAIADDASTILVEKIQQLAPKSEKAHKRYSTPKFSKGIRAPKGKGRVVATYLPGNLKGSIRKFKYKRSSRVIVGAKFRRKNAEGVFGKSRRYDAYYAHMVEYGTRHSAAQPFVRPAVAAVKGQVKKKMLDLVTARVNKFVRKNAV